jgi:hypothetical protein
VRSIALDVAVAIAATLAFVGLVTLVHPMTALDRQLLYWYQAPVGFVFVLFALDRWHMWPARLRQLRVLDAVVLSLSLSRTLTWLLPLSGHALFLSYAVLSSRRWPIIVADVVVRNAGHCHHLHGRRYYPAWADADALTSGFLLWRRRLRFPRRRQWPPV